MVPARNLLRRHYDTYGGGGCFDVDPPHFAKQSHPLRSNLMLMAEHQPSTTGDPAHDQITQEQQQQQQQQQEEAAAAAAELEAAGTGSIARPDDSWLQLGIGLGAPSSSSSAAAAAAAPSRPSVELELFSDRPSSSSTSSLPTASSYGPTGPPPTPPVFSSMGYRPPPWGFWSSNLMQYGTAGGGGSSISTAPPPMMMMMPPTQFYNVQRFPLPPPAAAAVGSGGPRFGEMRVVSPPAAARQHHTGVWFLLRAAENQVREPFLPQIPKSYIRIKDGRMTVRLLMKYLVKKLGLDDESEVQISCRGQPLPPFLTLQHVRDNIWCPSEAVAFLPDSPSIDHVMTLQYGRSP